MLELLPNELREELSALGGYDAIGELHLRAGRPSSVVLNGCNRLLVYRAARTTLEGILLAACGGSLYAYRDSIREGYVTLTGGVRMGIAGRAVTEGEDVVAVTSPDTLCFRIPHAVPGVAETVCRMWQMEGGRDGVLIIAPPGSGKTTFLRDMIITLSAGRYARRVAVVDSREELCAEGVGGMVDVLRGYPRARGLEIALRTLSPEVLVCDEIGADEVMGIRDVLHGGVPLVAAMHGSSLTDLMRRPAVFALMEAGVFSLVVTLRGARGGWGSEVTHYPC